MIIYVEICLKNKWNDVQSLKSFSKNWIKTKTRKDKIKRLLK